MNANEHLSKAQFGKGQQAYHRNLLVQVVSVHDHPDGYRVVKVKPAGQHSGGYWAREDELQVLDG